MLVRPEPPLLCAVHNRYTLLLPCNVFASVDKMCLPVYANGVGVVQLLLEELRAAQHYFTKLQHVRRYHQVLNILLIYSYFTWKQTLLMLTIKQGVQCQELDGSINQYSTAFPNTQLFLTNNFALKHFVFYF